VTQIFNILPSDRGRPITDLSSRLSLPGLADDVKRVLQTGQAIEHHIEHEGREGHFLVRLLPYRDANQRTDGVVVSFIDVTSVTRAESHQRTLIAELNHRVKNMLTVAISIAEQTFVSTPDSGEFKTAYLDRLRAMARSYELLSRENWIEASMSDLIVQEVNPVGAGRVAVEGPPTSIKPSDALSLGMILHELATNAAKHGALSVKQGRVAVTWSISDASPRRIQVVWQESGGRRPALPLRKGFGLKLIKREANFSLGGSSAVDFQDDGLRVSVEFPLS
jgi:two-component system CheB/CheR fusion protein